MYNCGRPNSTSSYSPDIYNSSIVYEKEGGGGGELSATEQWANGWITWDSFFDVVILFLTDSTYVADQRQNGADNVSHMTAR